MLEACSESSNRGSSPKNKIRLCFHLAGVPCIHSESFAEFYRYPLRLTLIQWTSTVPMFVVLKVPKIYIWKTQRQFLFPNVMTQLLTNIHRPCCVQFHWKVLNPEVRQLCISKQILNQSTPASPQNTDMLWLWFCVDIRNQEVILYFCLNWNTVQRTFIHNKFIAWML